MRCWKTRRGTRTTPSYSPIPNTELDGTSVVVPPDIFRKVKNIATSGDPVGCSLIVPNIPPSAGDGKWRDTVAIARDERIAGFFLIPGIDGPRYARRQTVAILM